MFVDIGMIAQSVEHITPGKEGVASIPILTLGACFLLVGSLLL